MSTFLRVTGGFVKHVLLAILVLVVIAVAFWFRTNPIESNSDRLWIELSQQPGWRSTNSGGLFFEGPITEYSQGINCQDILMLTRNRQNAQRMSASYVLRLDLAEDAPLDSKIAQIIPKKFASHLDQLKFRFQAIDGPIDFANLPINASRSYSISELEEMGCVQVVDEDPFVFWVPLGIKQVIELAILGGTLLVLADTDKIDIIDKGDVVPVFTRMNSNIVMSDSEKLKWVNERIGEYCDTIRNSARRNNIPARLLAAVVLNELSDYDTLDQYQEFIYTGENRSHGEVQLQVRRVLDHGLIDIATTPEVPIRMPGVDISYDEYRVLQFQSNRITNPQSACLNKFICERIQRFESGIEIAAREIAYLLKLLQRGSKLCQNPWPSSLLTNPQQGIDLGSIYENLKIDPEAPKPVNVQLEREKTLAQLVTSAYNGGGAIYYATNRSSIFRMNDEPWVQQHAQGSVPAGLQQPIMHGINSREWAEILYQYKDQICPVTLLPGRYRGTLVNASPDLLEKKKSAIESNGNYSIDATHLFVELRPDDTAGLVGQTNIKEGWKFNKQQTGPFAEWLYSYSFVTYSHTVQDKQESGIQRLGPDHFSGIAESVELMNSDGSYDAPGFEGSSGPLVPKPTTKQVRWRLWIDSATGKIMGSITDELRDSNGVLPAYVNPVFQWRFQFEMEFLGDTAGG